jgi:hypothetical protein
MKTAGKTTKTNMKTYHIKFSYNGEDELKPQVRSFKAASVIRAFDKCLKEYPGSKLIEGWREGGFLDGYGITKYQPPSTARIAIETEPAPKLEQLKLNLSLPES